MTFIRTIEGDIAPGDLGFTYSHEHIVCEPPYWLERREDDLLLDDPEISLLDVVDFRNAGGRSIVDATCVDYGRDLDTVRALARKAGVHIVATAGFNKSFLWNAKMPGRHITFRDWIEEASVEDLTRFIVDDVEKGVGEAGSKCGQIKFGTGYNSISDLEIKTIRAAAQAYHRTGAPVHSHTEGGTMALEQMRFLRKEGIPPEHVSFGHMDRNLDPWMHRKVAESGAYLCFDGIGKVKYGPESARVACILELVKHGHEKQILISGDTARKSYYKHYKNGPGLEYIIKTWIPRFVEEAGEAGFDGAKLVDSFFVHNPAACFAFKR